MTGKYYKFHVMKLEYKFVVEGETNDFNDWCEKSLACAQGGFKREEESIREDLDEWTTNAIEQHLEHDPCNQICLPGGTCFCNPSPIHGERVSDVIVRLNGPFG